MVKSSQFLLFGVFNMSEVNEQRVYIKFYLKLGKNVMEMYVMIKTAIGNDLLIR